MISSERRGEILLLRMSLPPLNLLGSTMISSLQSAFAAAVDEPPRVAVLFCAGAGADVREMVRFDPADARAFITTLHRACRAIRDLDAPVIAAIDGPCLGAHLEVAAACDLRIASPSSRFGMPEVRVGIPSVIDAWWLAFHCGLGNAAALVYEGTMIDAAEAHRIGLLNRLSSGSLEEDAIAWAQHIARSAQSALGLQKQVLREWTEEPYVRAAERSIERLAEAFAHPSTAEAMHAMLEKREPRF